MQIVKAVYADRTIADIFLGKVSPIYWNEIKQIQMSSGGKISELFGINNLCEYALKAFFAYSNAVDAMRFCVHYRPKTDKEELGRRRQYQQIVERGQPYRGPLSGDNDLYRTCGIITGVADGRMFIKDRSDTVSILYCNKCLQTYWGKYRKEKVNGQKVPLEAGQKCYKTPDCNGTLVSGKTYLPKNLLISNIEYITNNLNEAIDFQPFLYKAAESLRKNGADALEERVQEVTQRHRDQVMRQRKNFVTPDEEEETKMETENKNLPEKENEEEESNIIASNKKMMSLAQIRKKKNKEYEKLKKVWNPTEEAVYDYWINLYGGGVNNEDAKSRQEFCDALVKNN